MKILQIFLVQFNIDATIRDFLLLWATFRDYS